MFERPKRIAIAAIKSVGLAVTAIIMVVSFIVSMCYPIMVSILENDWKYMFLFLTVPFCVSGYALAFVFSMEALSGKRPRKFLNGRNTLRSNESEIINN